MGMVHKNFQNHLQPYFCYQDHLVEPPGSLALVEQLILTHFNLKAGVYVLIFEELLPIVQNFLV
jgi:hypothetical protein